MTEHLGMTADERGQALTSAQKQARQVAEVLTAAYLEFRAAAPDVSIDELKTSGERG